VDSLRRQTQPLQLSVALDQKYRCERFLVDIADDPSIRALQVSPNPAGPYVAYHVLSARSDATHFLRQDCDDFSLPPRAATLLNALREQGVDMVGSQALQINEVTRTVYPTRHPLDANEGVRRAGILHQVLFPALLFTQRTLIETGGFSTERIFGHDIDFWLRAFLKLRIVNVDEFLYIRRRHPRSLTMRPDIGIGSDVRRAIRAARAVDLAAILAGERRLEQTSLALRHRPGFADFRDLRMGTVERVRPTDIVPGIPSESAARRARVATS
jgi:hypothetical protein